jgi:hypothetical protein
LLSQLDAKGKALAIAGTIKQKCPKAALESLIAAKEATMKN